MEAGEGGEDGFPAGEVEGGGGFVEQEKLGLADQGAGEEGAETFSGGKGVIKLIGVAGEADLCEQVAGVVALVGRGVEVAQRQGGEVAAGGDVVGGHVVIEGVDGGGFDDADLFAEGRDGDFAQGLAEELDGALLRPEVGAGEAEEGGFAAAVGAEDGGDLVRVGRTS